MVDLYRGEERWYLRTVEQTLSFVGFGCVIFFLLSPPAPPVSLFFFFSQPVV